MSFDIVFAGVGGQGVLSLANLIAAAAAEDGLVVKQSEVHGMSQRGGSVTAHLRLSALPIDSPLIARGTASMILALEPLEALRSLDYLGPDGVVVTATDPVRNLLAYPDVDGVLEQLRAIPGAVLIDAAPLARQAGLTSATNVVLAGAAAQWLPVGPGTLESCLRITFRDKGASVVEKNLAAFRSGQELSCRVMP
jgi:indolepyruvate ferredoxin oxidoreductase beta subunit